ncbi:hypothetical protein KIN20_018011 [Parelaphostrongylus tenuis]|uniref:Uncharacterized protein n=1 Tax=Parelaphostrongylus tenuis TaxID=148309 RepID=A0AAD5MMC2_PARTN|nr:hypothetical protein KIN20_018011 [Parelaphostrongylus tenuis]
MANPPVTATESGVGQRIASIHELTIVHEYSLGLSAGETSRWINAAWGDETVGKTTRFNEFRAVSGDLTYRKGAGRPKEIERRRVLNATEMSPSLRIRIKTWMWVEEKF